MRKLILFVLCVGLLAGCGKKPSVLEIPAPPRSVQNPQPQPLPPQQPIVPNYSL